MVTMLPAFYCKTSCHIGANFRVPAVGPPFPMKIFGARKESGWASKEAECTCVHFFRVISSRRRHPVQPHLRSRRCNSYSSLHFCSMIDSYNRGTPDPLAIKQVICETVSQEASAKEPTNAASKFSLIGLPAVALALSVGFVGQPACAAVNPAVLPEVGVQMEVVSDNAPSVEAILAQQLARRFREMSDEELVDILQQLIKASRSSLNSQNAADGEIVPQDLVIRKENREIKTKGAGKIGEDVRIPPTLKTDNNPGKEVKKDESAYSETQPGNVRAPNETREGSGGEAPLPQANNRLNGQVDKRKSEKIYDKANSKEPQGQGLPAEMENAGKVPSKARFSETQKSLRGGNSEMPGAPSTENNSGDASVRSNSDSSATSGQTSAAELSSGTADNNAKGGVREEEDLTELLWAEWIRRVDGPVMQEPETSSTSFNFAEFGQDAIMKVAAFNVLQSAGGVFIIWFFFMVLAFYLGRSRAASSRKDTPKGEDSPLNNLGNQTSKAIKARGDLELGSATLSRVSDYLKDSGKGLREFMSKGDRESDSSNREKKNYEADFLSGEGETSMKEDQPAKGKRWRTPLIESLLIKETSARNNQGIVDELPRDSILGSDAEDWSSPSSNGGTRIDSASSGPSGSDGINSEMEQLQDRPRGAATSGVPQASLYSSVDSVDSSSSKLQAADDWPRHARSQSKWEVDWRDAKVEGARDNYPSVKEKDQGEPSTSDAKHVSTMSKRAVILSSEGRNLDHGRAASPTGDLYSRIFEKLSSRKFVEDLDTYEQVGQKDSPEDFNGKHGAREGEGSADSQSESELNSFVHDHVLWVRDGDGIFVRQAVAMEEGLDEYSQATSFSTGEEDMPEFRPSFDSERNSRTVGKSNPPSSVGSMKPRRVNQTGFDYRRLVIESKDQFSRGEQQGIATESEPTAVRQHMWPLRYMSGRQEVSQ